MKDLKCTCGKIASYKANMKFNGRDIDGWECRNCGGAYYNPEKAERILLLNKIQKLKHSENIDMEEVFKRADKFKPHNLTPEELEKMEEELYRMEET